MLSWLKSLFAAIAGVFRYLGDRQLIDAGKAEEVVDALAEEKKREELAKDAVVRSDPERSERLRKKYTRPSGK